MASSYEFLRHALDSITEHIVVIDEIGNIQFVNKSWSAFGDSNDCLIANDWSNVNYLEECDKASAMGDEFGSEAGIGIRNVITQKNNFFI
jgi:PAS domain-containing protein